MTTMNEPTAEVLSQAEQIKAAAASIFRETEKTIEAKHPHAYAAACVVAAKQFFKEAGYSQEQQVMLVKAIAEGVTFSDDGMGQTTFLG